MSVDAKLIKIGNSQGLRIPKSLIIRYKLDSDLVLEEKKEGIFIRPKVSQKLTWDQTFKEMSLDDESWDSWNELDVDSDPYL